MTAPYGVTILQLDNGGFHVSVGCKALAYTSVDKLVGDLIHYFSDPAETIKRMSKAHGWALETGSLIGGAVPDPPQRVPWPKELAVAPNVTSDYGREPGEGSGFTGR